MPATGDRRAWLRARGSRRRRGAQAQSGFGSAVTARRMTLEYMKYHAVLGREGVRRITRDRPAAVAAETETAPEEKAAP